MTSNSWINPGLLCQLSKALIKQIGITINPSILVNSAICTPIYSLHGRHDGFGGANYALDKEKVVSFVLI